VDYFSEGAGLQAGAKHTTDKPGHGVPSTEGRGRIFCKSGYKFSKVYEFRGKSHYKSFLGAGVKARSVTNNLPLLSVLGAALD
jgi:hypothetical protein